MSGDHTFMTSSGEFVGCIHFVPNTPSNKLTQDKAREYCAANINSESDLLELHNETIAEEFIEFLK